MSDHGAVSRFLSGAKGKVGDPGCTCTRKSYWYATAHEGNPEGHYVDCPLWGVAPPPDVSRELTVIGDEFSWEAVIGLDYGRVSREDAKRVFDEHGILLPPEGPEEQRFIEVPVSPGKDWEREFEPNHNGPIHGWMVEW